MFLNTNLGRDVLQYEINAAKLNIHNPIAGMFNRQSGALIVKVCTYICFCSANKNGENIVFIGQIRIVVKMRLLWNDNE